MDYLKKQELKNPRYNWLILGLDFVSIKDLKAQYSKEPPEDSPGSIRAGECDRNKIDIGLEMISRALKEGFKADYVLVDSWFFGDKFASFFIGRTETSGPPPLQ